MAHWARRSLRAPCPPFTLRDERSPAAVSCRPRLGEASGAACTGATMARVRHTRRRHPRSGGSKMTDNSPANTRETAPNRSSRRHRRGGKPARGAGVGRGRDDDDDDHNGGADGGAGRASNPERPARGHDHDEGRHADLLQGLGQGAAGGVQPRLAADGRRVRGPDAVPRRPRLPLRRARPPRARPLEPAVGRQRHRDLRRRPRPARCRARPPRRGARRALDRRRRGGGVRRAARPRPRRQGRADQRDPPIMVRTAANPEGSPISVFDGIRAPRSPTARRTTRTSPPRSTGSTAPARRCRRG